MFALFHEKTPQFRGELQAVPQARSLYNYITEFVLSEISHVWKALLNDDNDDNDDDNTI